MKVNISIEFDKELATAIMDTVREISKGMKSLQGIFDKSDWTVKTESAPEPKPEQPKPARKRKTKAQTTLRSTVLKVIKQNKDGISRKDLQEETGISGKQISNLIYQLKKNQKIQMTEDGLLKLL
jgi:predicted HTH transcriptional regulator